METQIFLTDLTRYINIGLSIIGFVFWIYLYVKYKQPGMIAPIIWLANLSLFYMYVFSLSPSEFNEDVIENLNIWAASIHMLAAILLLAAAITVNSYINEKKCKKLS